MKAKAHTGAILFAIFAVGVLAVIVIAVASPERRSVRTAADPDAPRKEDQRQKSEGEQRPSTTEGAGEKAVGSPRGGVPAATQFWTVVGKVVSDAPDLTVRYITAVKGIGSSSQPANADRDK